MYKEINMKVRTLKGERGGGGGDKAAVVKKTLSWESLLKYHNGRQMSFISLQSALTSDIIKIMCITLTNRQGCHITQGEKSCFNPNITCRNFQATIKNS